MVSFVSKLRSLVWVNRKGGKKGNKAKEGKGKGLRAKLADLGSNPGDDEDGDADPETLAGEDSNEEDGDRDSFDFSEDNDNERGDFNNGPSSKRKSVLTNFLSDEETGLNTSLKFAVQKVFKPTEKNALALEDDQVVALESRRGTSDTASTTTSGRTSGERMFAKNPFFHLSSLVGSCIDKSLHLLVKRDFKATLKQLEEMGVLPETVSPNSPLCRSADKKAQRKNLDQMRGGGPMLFGNHKGKKKASSENSPSCWGLLHAVFGMDRRRLLILRNTIESAEGCQRAFQFSLTLSEFSAEDLDTLDGPRKNVKETLLLSTMLSIQRTTLGCLSTRLDGFQAAGANSKRFQSLRAELPAIIGLQEDVVVSGTNLTSSLATFVQHLLLQIQDLMDSKLHVIEGLYVTDKPIHPATFRVNQFDEMQSNDPTVKSGTANNRGIKFGLSEMFDTLEDETTKTSLVFVKAIKRAVLQQKIITLSVILHVEVHATELNQSIGAKAKDQERIAPKRLMRAVKRYVFHHDKIDEVRVEDAISHYSADPFEAIYNGVFLSQKAVRRYAQLYEFAPMEAVVFEPNLAKRKEIISDFLSHSDLESALCEIFSFALLEWSQDVYNTQSSISPKQLHHIIEAIVNGPSEEEDILEEFDEYHMLLLSAVMELASLDSSLSSQISAISHSAGIILDVLNAELKDSEDDEISFLKTKEDESVEKGSGFDFLMDHVGVIVSCLEDLESLGILEMASSNEDAKIVRNNLSKTLEIVNKDPSHTFLLINQLYRAFHLTKSCASVLSSAFLHELNSTKELVLDVRAKYLSSKNWAPTGKGKKHGKKDKKNKKNRKAEAGGVDKREDEGTGSEGQDMERTAYPIALLPIEKAQPGILDNLQLAAQSGLEVVLGALVWQLTQPPIPIDPYPRCIKLLKGAASAHEVSTVQSTFGGRGKFTVANQMVMLGNCDNQEFVNPLFPVYVAGGVLNNSLDAIYGSYTALQYCEIESVGKFVNLLMEQILNSGRQNGDNVGESPSSNLWHLFGERSFHRSTCDVDIVQSLDGSLSINKIAAFRKGSKKNRKEGAQDDNDVNIGIQTVREYYLIRGKSVESVGAAAYIFADNVIEHIRAFCTVGQSHVLESNEARSKGGLILDIQVNHPDFMFEDKQKLLSGILSTNFYQAAKVQQQSDPFHKLLERIAYQSILANKTEQLVSVLIAQNHETLGYIPVVKSIFLSYCDSVTSVSESIPMEAHSQIFLDEDSALLWHNWFDKMSYTASCTEFIKHLFQSKAGTGVEKDKRSAEQITSSLYSLKLFSKAFDSVTQLCIDSLRACIAVQNVSGIQLLGHLLSADCYSSISKIMASAILLEAFLDGKSIHIEQMLTTDMHGEMLGRIKLVLEGLIEELKDVIRQDWASPIGRPIEVFLHNAEKIKNRIMKGSFEFAVSHVKSVLLWGIECSNYISSAVDISTAGQIQDILERLSTAEGQRT